MPAVITRWEGTELFNYSPLIYAYHVQNIALTGKGTINGNGSKKFSAWADNQNIDKEILRRMGRENLPIYRRIFGEGFRLRPGFIEPYGCANVRIEGITIKDSPFWVIHPIFCNNVIVRDVTVDSHNRNNDGCDPESCSNVLIEGCTFSTGDDAIAIKSGRDNDAWRIGQPTENVVIRNCTFWSKINGVCIGSEISGGIRNIYMHDCTAPNSVMRLFFVKTNHRRGGFIENVYMKNVKAGTAQRVLEIDTEVLYQWKDLVPTYEERITRIDGIYMDKVTCESADAIYELKGNSKLPAKNVMIRDVKVGEVKEFVKKVNNVENVVEKNVTYDRKGK